MNIDSNALMRKIGDAVKVFLPKDFGFCTLIFKFNESGRANYISNANRQIMIKALFETAYRLKENEDKSTIPIYKDGEPCDHIGCLNHVSHPCEGCGRIAGQNNLMSFDKIHNSAKGLCVGEANSKKVNVENVYVLFFVHYDHYRFQEIRSIQINDKVFTKELIENKYHVYDYFEGSSKEEELSQNETCHYWIQSFEVLRRD